MYSGEISHLLHSRKAYDLIRITRMQETIGTKTRPQQMCDALRPELLSVLVFTRLCRL